MGSKSKHDLNMIKTYIYIRHQNDVFVYIVVFCGFVVICQFPPSTDSGRFIPGQNGCNDAEKTLLQASLHKPRAKPLT